MTAGAGNAPAENAASPPREGRATRVGRWLGTEAPFVVVFAVLVLAVVYLAIWGDHWRRGIGIITVALFLAAGFRAVLPGHRAGMLAVRGRWRDTLCYLVLGGGLLAAAIRLH